MLYLTTHSTYLIYAYMVNDHSNSERGNLLPPHELLFSISSKGSFICIIPQTGWHIPQPLLHHSLAGTRNYKYDLQWFALYVLLREIFWSQNVSIHLNIFRRVHWNKGGSRQTLCSSHNEWCKFQSEMRQTRKQGRTGWKLVRSFQGTNCIRH